MSKDTDPRAALAEALPVHNMLRGGDVTAIAAHQADRLAESGVRLVTMAQLDAATYGDSQRILTPHQVMALWAALSAEVTE